MSSRYQGRHRAPRRPLTLPAAPTRSLAGGASVAVAATLAFGTAQAQAAPVTAAVPTVAVPAAPVTTTFRPATPVAALTGTVRYGQRGANVRVVQAKVGVGADGIFGSKTLAAVKRFQSANGLVADGIVGAKTAAAMGLGRAAATATRSTETAASRSTTRTPIASASGVLGTARSLLGIPYRWGGTTPAGFDCSGFTQYVFAKHGISLPRTTEAQRKATTRVSNPQPGDLVFFGIPATHVGIYAGNGQLVDAGRSGLKTSQRNIWRSTTVTYHRP